MLYSGAGSEPAFLVKLVVIGEESLGNYGEDSTSANGYRAVVKLSPAAQRRSDEYQRVILLGLVGETEQVIFGAVEKLLVVEKVAASVGSEAQLRIYY